MAEAAKKTLPKKPPLEAVNSEQLEALEAQGGTETIIVGPSIGELEERAVEAENAVEAEKRRNEDLEAELNLLKAQMAILVRQKNAQKTAKAPEELAPGETPVFDEEQPYGLVVGDDAAAYVQNGHQFGRDKQYIATETHRGAGRAFNPRLVGLTKPRPGAASVDVLDGIRGRD